ncbi:MAG: radical SAM family heme chaperone HemW [Chloroflexi bacterium]|nr:radical SAM family heme chaperone HemW [Chloroflexota bacterium]
MRSSHRQTAGLYIHIPFCDSKCWYCDFTSFVGREGVFEPYLGALRRELLLRLPAWSQVTFDSLYVGGGTPTVIPASLLADFIGQTLALIPKTHDIEVTVEANPSTLDEAAVRKLLDAGVNRLSIGVQSWHSEELARLGRRHSPQAASVAIAAAHSAGCTNISLDLMLGLPAQTTSTWDETLQRSLALQPEHLSVYTLTLEPDTPLAHEAQTTTLDLPDDERCAELYAMARNSLAQAGYGHYELSNWARRRQDESADARYPGFAARHNLHYWHNERYLGLGVAAFSFDGLTRWGNTCLLDEYLAVLSQNRLPVSEQESLSGREALGETIMLGLRLLDGVYWDELTDRYAIDARALYARQIAGLSAEGLLEADALGMRLMPRALYVANRVLSEFV